MRHIKHRIQQLKARPVRSNTAIWCGGIIVLVVLFFVAYASMPNTKIPYPDSNRWGIVVLLILLLDGAILLWGLGPEPDDDECDTK